MSQETKIHCEAMIVSIDMLKTLRMYEKVRAEWETETRCQCKKENSLRREKNLATVIDATLQNVA